jgi:CRP-like cAMP-binding protein
VSVAPRPRERPRSVSVLELDPSLVAGLDPAAAAAARRAALAASCVVEPGSWDGRAEVGGRTGDLGLLIAEGLLGRTVAVGAQECTELLGGGDLIRPWDVADDLASIPATTTWTVFERTTVVLLDERFVGRMCTWPPVMAALAKRMMDRTRALAFHLAVTQVTRVDERLLVVLWHLADRWGRVTPDGVVLALPLTHETLGRIVGARRPTVTTALRELSQRGLVTRGKGRSWLLHGGPPGDLRERRARVAG